MQKENREIAIKVSNLKKRYKLGQIGGGTLQGDLQSWWAKIRGKEDPNSIIGQEDRLVGQNFMALNNVNLVAYKGEALGIIGGNGAGKSTLLKILSRVTAPTEGEIELFGRIASMLEVGTGFNGEMTGRENVYMNGAILGMTKNEIDEKMEEIIEFSEVREFIDTPVKRYSSGMYVKLAFSVAAHLDSEIMIMDEVLAVGDMAFQKKCLDKMREVAKKEGRTVLYVSHNMNTIRQLCDRCVVLDKGKIIYEGCVEDSIEVYLGTAGKLKNHYEYTKEYHINNKSKGKLLLESMKIKNSEEMRFECGDKIEMLLTSKATINLERVNIRFEIQFQDGTKVGTMFLEDDVKFCKNEQKCLQLIFDTAHLVPGRYYVDIVGYEYDQFGNEDFLDGVYPGLSFEITDKTNKDNSLVWLHSYWGHTHLHNVEIREIIEEGD